MKPKTRAYLAATFAACLAGGGVLAERTRFWRQSTTEEFEDRKSVV